MRMMAVTVLALAGCAPQAGPSNNDGVAAVDGSDNAAASLKPGSPENDGATMNPPADPFRACDGGKADALLGQPVDAALRAKAMQLVGARLTRVIPPGAMVTMDYRGDRLNIHTDTANKAVRFQCG